MKKFILVFAATVLAAVAVSAQPRAIGARLGWGAEVSYQHSLGVDNMLSAELSFPGFAAVGAAATYDWLNPFNTAIPWNHKGEWNWYMGVGGGASYWFGGFLNVGVAGRVGVEYDFWFPLQLSFDWRPVIGPDIYFGGAAGDSETHVGFSGYGFYAGAISLGVRYKF